MKKTLPYAPSLKLKGASQYSRPCKNVKYKPKRIVRINLILALVCWLDNTLWCLHVTDTPEARRTILFSNGTPIGLNAAIPMGGQDEPTSGDGAKLE